jgi:hypothetical protein
LLLLGFAAVASLTSTKAKNRHLDRSDSQFFREPRSGETPHFALAVACSFVCHSAAQRRNLLLESSPSLLGNPRL